MLLGEWNRLHANILSWNPVAEIWEAAGNLTVPR